MLTLFRERYEVLAMLGSGGEAQIMKALDRQHGRFVALKVRPVRDQAAREDMLGEARVLLSLPPHPALPLVREDFFDRDDYVVAMDWVDGTDLATLLADRGRPGLAPSSVLAYLAQAAEALTHLHAQSPPVIHGDVKPGNLILTKGGQIKLVDFGLSSAPDVPRRRAGTPGYRAPELAAGGNPSRASDVYALAATAFALLTGSAPAGVLPAWEGFETAQAQQLEAAIRLGMATDPARRPKAPGELVERLRAGWSAALPTGVLTFCCSDIEGSTALWESNPEAMAEALVRHDELIADAVEARRGSLIKSMGEGDSTVSVFESAPAAVEAAFAANRSLAAEEWPAEIRIAARWGIHTGEAERRDADYFGPSVILAARVRAEAGGGEILLSSVTSELVSSHLPAGCSLVDLGSHRLKGVGAPERIHAVAGPGLRTTLSASECPYRGLLAFEQDDRAYFFGREAVVAELVGRAAPGRLLAVVGASGSGKSSVLRAGLLAAARAGEVSGIDDAVLLTPGAEPRFDVPDEPARLVVVDQFEELFTVCDDAELRARFIDALLASRCALAIGMRADLYGRVGGHAALARAVATNQLLLGAMTTDELGRAVTEPARLAGLKLEPGLVDLILRDVAAEPGALPLLSHALRATWEQRDGRTLTADGYRDSGGVASAIARTADAVVDALPDRQRPLARSVFLRMTELGAGVEDSRRRVAVAELLPEGVDPGTVHALLERLADARLITLGDGSAEVAHEALIREWPRLRQWLEEDRAGIRAHRQLGDAARLWDAGGREPTDLLRGPRLAAAVDLTQAGHVELNATERAFLDAGVDESERERRAEQRVNRRLRGLLAGALVLLAAAVVAGIVSLAQRDKAQTAESAAQRQALSSDAERVGALALSAPTLEHSMLFAVAGVELEDRVETRGDLLAVLQRNPAAIASRRLSSATVTALAVSPDGRLLASGDDRGVVRFMDLAALAPTGAEVRVPGTVGGQAMTFAPDGRTLAVGTQRRDRYELELIDVATRRARSAWSRVGAVPDDEIPGLTLAYAPGGRRLALGVATPPRSLPPPPVVEQRIVLLDARSGRPLWQRRVRVRTGQWETRVLFTPDGRLVTSAPQGETAIWNTTTGRITRRFAVGGRPALAPDGHTLAIALNSLSPGEPSAGVGLLDLRTGERSELEQTLPEEWITELEFTPDGSRLVGEAFLGAHVWDLASGAIVDSFGQGATAFDSGVALGPRGTMITGSGGGAAAVWDIDGGRRVGRRFEYGSNKQTCMVNPCTVIDPQGKLMATGFGDGTVGLVDLATGRLRRTLPGHKRAPAEALGFTAGGRRLVTGAQDGSVTIWDVPSGAIVRRLRVAGPVLTGTVSPDGRLLAVARQARAGPDVRVEVSDLPTGRARYTRRLPYGAWDVKFSPDGRALFAVGCCQGGSRVAGWDAPTGARRFVRDTGRDHTLGIAVLRDSSGLLVGGEDGGVAIWDARTGRQRGPKTTVDAGGVTQIAVSPGGRQFAVGTWDGVAALWDLRSRKRIGEGFPIERGLTPAVAFDPRGRLLITELGDAILWPTELPTLQRFACRVAGRTLTRDEWDDLLPARPYSRVCTATTQESQRQP